jgi:hypothetical protein
LLAHVSSRKEDALLPHSKNTGVSLRKHNTSVDDEIAVKHHPEYEHQHLLLCEQNRTYALVCLDSRLSYLAMESCGEPSEVPGIFPENRFPIDVIRR